MLALLGGRPAFPDGLPFARPAVPPLDRVAARLAPSYERGQLTNGPLVAELEAAVAERVGVEHVVAVASCTSGLMLALQALDIHGPVVVPSFTFSAGPHAVAWNGLGLRFAECDPASFLLDLADATALLAGAGAVMATHTFGAPCHPHDVEQLARDAGVPAVFDAAHAFGATHAGVPVGGFGDVEVFSLTPTKPLVAGEGGLVVTRRPEVAEQVRIGRDYGNPGDYDTRFVGLNARLSELHAAVALEALATLDEHLARRRRLAARYAQALAGVPGIAVQAVAPGDVSTWKDFTIRIDPADAGLRRDTLRAALHAEGIDTRCYFDPPVHRQQSHAASADRPLPVTEQVAATVLSLPLHAGMDEATVERVAALVADAVASAAELEGFVHTA